MRRVCNVVRAAVVLMGAGVVLAAGNAAAMPRGEHGRAVKRAHTAIRELRLEKANELLAPVVQRHSDDADVLYVQGLLRFHDSDYAGALRALDESLQQAPAAGENDDRHQLRELVAATKQATEKFEQTSSSDGRFIVSHAPGPDGVLAAYAIEALAGADDALTEELGVRVPGPVHLEIYPTAASLAEVSTLSLEAIRRTGTIALCKWDRLMITSPRALVRGYPWMDTIAHEYVHLVLSRASRDRAPVWFQEGVAKFLERRWRGDVPRARLDPAAEGLLYEAVRERELIPFDRLHPSIALLPSQRDAALAFAQVATFFEVFYQDHGAEGLRAAVGRVARETDARDALAQVADKSWSELEAHWKGKLRERPGPRSDPPRLLGLRFRHGDRDDESLEIEHERARRFVRLGDLLWERGRAGAAKVEYGKAHRKAPQDPIVSSRLARAALRAGDAKKAIDAIAAVAERYPEHAPAHAVLAAAQLANGDAEAARTAAREAIRLNPFNPRPHCVLSQAGSDEAERRHERQVCRRLGGTPP